MKYVCKKFIYYCFYLIFILNLFLFYFIFIFILYLFHFYFVFILFSFILFHFLFLFYFYFIYSFFIYYLFIYYFIIYLIIKCFGKIQNYKYSKNIKNLVRSNVNHSVGLMCQDFGDQLTEEWLHKLCLCF